MRTGRYAEHSISMKYIPTLRLWPIPAKAPSTTAVERRPDAYQRGNRRRIEMPTRFDSFSDTASHAFMDLPVTYWKTGHCYEALWKRLGSIPTNRNGGTTILQEHNPSLLEMCRLKT